MLNLTIFNIIFFKVLTALFGILIGFIAGKFYRVQRESIGTLLLYFMAPVIFFAAPMNLNLTFAVLSITLLTTVIFCGMGIANYWWLGKMWQDNSRNMLALSSTTTNCGYFMIPIASTIFDESSLSIYMLSILGVTLSESSVGFYLLTRSIGSAKQSLKKVLTLPTFNAFVLGSILGLLGLKLPEFLNDFVYNIRVAYAVMGMIMIGLGLSTLDKFEFDFRFAGTALLINFVIQPIVCLTVILLDKFIFQIYTTDFYKSLILIAICPVAANTVVVSNIINFPIQKIAGVVFISLLADMIIVPLVISMGPF